MDSCALLQSFMFISRWVMCSLVFYSHVNCLCYFIEWFSLRYLFLCPFQVTKYWSLSDELCDAWVAFDVMACTASILNLTAISVDRLVKVPSVHQKVKQNIASHLTWKTIVFANRHFDYNAHTVNHTANKPVRMFCSSKHTS